MVPSGQRQPFPAQCPPPRTSVIDASSNAASMGAIFHVPFELDVDIGSLAQRFQRIAYLDMSGSQLTDPEFKAFDCYVFGNEARGVPANQLAGLHARPFTIAGSGAIESLNLATAVNMCVYEICRQANES